MATGHLYSRILLPAAGPILLACVFSGLASAGNNVRVVPLCSDDRGNQAWVEIESDGGRTTAKPFVAVGKEGLGKVLENPNENGALAIPIPKLMRFVERAREVLRNMKRPGAAPPAPPDAAAAEARPASRVAERRETAPCLTVSFGPPDCKSAVIHPPVAMFSPSGR